MPKKKSRKNSKEKQIENYAELVGIFCILISIIGIGKYGPVGKAISSFSMFLVGSLYILLLVFVLGVGIFMVVKRERPNYLSSKFIGLYVALIGVVVLLHKEYVVQNKEFWVILEETVDVLMNSIDKIMTSSVKSGIVDITILNSGGGGIIGGLFSALFNFMFDYNGMLIVSWILVGAGFLIFTSFGIFDLLKDTKKKLDDMIPVHEKSTEKQDIPPSDSYDDISSKFKINDNNDISSKDENKTVIKDLSELTHNVNVSLEQEDEEKKDVAVTNRNYILPSLDLLDKPAKNKKGTDRSVIEANSKKLVDTLRDFGIYGNVVAVNIGPSVIQYELELSQGTKLSKLLGLNREIALSLAKKDVRIQAPIPGKSTVGIEMPNENMQVVTLKETLEGLVKENKIKSKLSVGLGKDIMGHVQACHINKTPHLLVAGATGSGKSVCINCIILSILMFTKPDEVKLILVDPKKVELGVYNGVPHLVTPIVNDPKKASLALQKAVSEMDRRYDLFEETKTRNIESYNEYVDKYNKNKEEDEMMKRLPYWVVIVDELADLMLVAGKEVETSIARITQMARAAGIHLIIATQRPSTDVITGLIKANIPSRLAFTVSSQIDSRTILDMSGAEKLLGKGDMLYLPMGDIVPQRIQGAFVSDEEIERVVNYVIGQQIAQYDNNFFSSFEDKDQEIKNNMISNDEEEYDDPLYNDVVEFVITSGKASASLLQRRFKVGYNRAARIIDLLEERGIIGPQNGSKPREVLVELENKE